jgi:hypothetical protein
VGRPAPPNLGQPALQTPRRSGGLWGPSLAGSRPKTDPIISGHTAFKYPRKLLGQSWSAPLCQRFCNITAAMATSVNETSVRRLMGRSALSTSTCNRICSTFRMTDEQLYNRLDDGRADSGLGFWPSSLQLKSYRAWCNPPTIVGRVSLGPIRFLVEDSQAKSQDRSRPDHPQVDYIVANLSFGMSNTTKDKSSIGNKPPRAKG